MLRVTVELLPFGSEFDRRLVALLTITNSSPIRDALGDYEVDAREAKSHLSEGVSRRVVLRQEKSKQPALLLLHAALSAIIEDRARQNAADGRDPASPAENEAE